MTVSKVHSQSRHYLGPRLFLIALFFALVVSVASAARKERVVDSWRPTHYHVSLTFNNNLTEITTASTRITVLALKDSVSSIDLDFGQLIIDSVRVNETAAHFETANELLKVKLPRSINKGSSLVITVSYHGVPKDGLILSRDKAGKPSAVGDNWPNRVHHWIPTFDHPSAKAAVTFSVTAPSENLVVANGALTSVSNSSAATRTWTYTEANAIPPYCMIVAVGDFARIEPAAGSLTPLAYYVPPKDREFALSSFAPAIPSLKFFNETVAPYPYEKLAMIIGATRFGGMENSSAIVFPMGLLDSRLAQPLNPVFNIRQGLVEVVVHEVAHQWFGDSVTEATWADLWLSEGFADYFAGLFIERHEGKAAFQRYMQGEAEDYLGFAKSTRTPIHDTETEDLFKLLNANNYQKGAWVLHMLRAEVGNDNFFRSIRLYYDRHRHATATSEDLRRAFEEVSGRNLKQFFASWIYGAGHPSYELSWRWNRKTKKLRLVLNQLQKEPAFPNGVPIEIVAGEITRKLTLKPTSKQTIQELKLDRAPSAVSIDPDKSILKEARIREAQ